MSNHPEDKVLPEHPPPQPPPPVESTKEDVVSIDLPAPHGWTKKFIPKKGGTPKRNEIVFIAPTGEEIKNKRQLDQYLKSHSDGPSALEFEWTTGDTPRRSARLSSKSKATDTPESCSSRKRQKKSALNNVEEKKDETEEGESAEDVADAIKFEDGKDVEMKDVELRGEGSEVEESKETAVDTEASAKDLVENDDLGKQQGQEAAGRPSSVGNEVPLEENDVVAGVKLASAQVPEETGSDKSEVQPEVNKVETAKEQAETRVPPEVICSSREEQLEDNKTDAGSKLVDADLLKETNNAMKAHEETKEEPEEKPAESQVHPNVPVASINTSTEIDGNVAVPASADRGIEGSTLGVEDPMKQRNSEEVGADTNSAKDIHETADHNEKNHLVNHAGAPL